MCGAPFDGINLMMSFPSSPNTLLWDFQLSCPNFNERDVEEEAREVDISYLVQATFYAMTVAYARALDILTEALSDELEEVLEHLRWYSFELWLEANRDALLRANHRPFLQAGCSAP